MGILENTDTSVMDFATISKIGSFTLIVIIALWLLHWIPKWVLMVTSRYDEGIRRVDDMLEEMKKQTDHSDKLGQQYVIQVFEAMQQRHERLLATFKEDSEADRQAVLERNNEWMRLINEMHTRMLDRLVSNK